MDKAKFLLDLYLQIASSGAFVCEARRSNVDRFVADLWDRTPNHRNNRFLAPTDRSLGFAPGNVEWYFEGRRHKPGSKPKAKPKARPSASRKPPLKTLLKPTKEERAAWAASSMMQHCGGFTNRQCHALG